MSSHTRVSIQTSYTDAQMIQSCLEKMGIEFTTHSRAKQDRIRIESSHGRNVIETAFVRNTKTGPFTLEGNTYYSKFRDENGIEFRLNAFEQRFDQIYKLHRLEAAAKTKGFALTADTQKMHINHDGNLPFRFVRKAQQQTVSIGG